MDFFKFNNDGLYTEDYLERGEIINNIERATWVERYAEPGEFTFESKLGHGLRDLLPLGTMISHVDTLEVMIVEDHQISEVAQEEPTVVITGRSFPSWLENRVVGVNAARDWPTISPYNLSANYTWYQIVSLINDHISPGSVNNWDDALGDYITATTDISGSGVSVSREVGRGTVWERVSELLAVDHCGIRTRRRHSFDGSSHNTEIQIYKGVDRSASVLLSWQAGDLAAADYLFSHKNRKDTALIAGQNVWSVVQAAGIGYARYGKHTMYITATDMDENLDPPALSETGGYNGPVVNAVVAAMEPRARQVMSKYREVDITRAEVSKTSPVKYRKHYNMGDLITVDGNFNATGILQVTEYAEIEDENGESGHPTLVPPS